MSKKTIPLAQHIFKRLAQLNCKSIHGVPGDFFLRALDHIPVSGVQWIGNASELCAGYAADGYARAALTGLSRRKYAQSKSFSNTAAVGAVMTTYGVGELSAINAVGGAYSESVPLVHLVSTPSRKAMAAGEDLRRPVHHMMPGRGMEVYADMAKSVTCAQANLHKIERMAEAAEAYDEVLRTAVRESRPVYVSVGSDMWELPVPVELSEKKMEVDVPKNDAGLQKEVVEAVWSIMQKAKQPLVIADALCYPYDLQAEVDEIVRLIGFPTMSYMSGKGVVEEERDSFSLALPNTTEYSKNADLVMIFGPMLSDTNTARWSAIPKANTTLLFNLDSVEILKTNVRPEKRSESSMWRDIRVKELLSALVEKVKNNTTSLKTSEQAYAANQPPTSNRSVPASGHQIKQDNLWPNMSTYMRENDTLLLANGTPLIGARGVKLQSSSHVIASGIWNAIGSLLPCAQGVAAAKRDHNLPGRTIIFEGDGSLQVTVQSISDIIRYKLDVTIVIANNAGYTYERWLNGMDAEYNDVPCWKYTEAARFFGADLNNPEYPVYCKRVESWGDLVEMLKEEKASDGKGLKILDVVLDPTDVPEASKAGLLRAAESLKSG